MISVISLCDLWEATKRDKILLGSIKANFRLKEEVWTYRWSHMLRDSHHDDIWNMTHAARPVSVWLRSACSSNPWSQQKLTLLIYQHNHVEVFKMTTTAAWIPNRHSRLFCKNCFVCRWYLIKRYFFIFAAQLVCFTLIFHKVAQINICLIGSA